MGSKAVYNAHEMRFVDGDEAVQGLHQHRLHDVTAAHGVADGSELVDVPGVPFEKAAYAHDEVLVHHLSAGQEATLYMLHNLAFPDGREAHAFHYPAEEVAALEHRLHDIDSRAAEYIAEKFACLLFPQNGIQWPQNGIRIVQKAEAMEFVQDEYHAFTAVCRQTERQPEHGQDIFRIQFPVQGNHLITLGVGKRIEHEVCAVQIPLYDALEFLGGKRHHFEERGAQAKQEIFRRTDIQGRKLPHRKRLAPQTHSIERLLDKRRFSGFGRLIDGHVLPLGKQASQKGHVGLPANEMFAAYILSVWKRCFHYSAGVSSAAGSSASAGASSTTSTSSL